MSDVEHCSSLKKIAYVNENHFDFHLRALMEIQVVSRGLLNGEEKYNG
jgi:hypothetical protein